MRPKQIKKVRRYTRMYPTPNIPLEFHPTIISNEIRKSTIDNRPPAPNCLPNPHLISSSHLFRTPNPFKFTTLSYNYIISKGPFLISKTETPLSTLLRLPKFFTSKLPPFYPSKLLPTLLSVVSSLGSHLPTKRSFSYDLSLTVLGM